jgi:deoxyribose-phosphate aldolase
VAKCIDHTLLKPEATATDVDALCREAAEFGFASVCINPTFVPRAAQRLSGTPVAVCTVVGFPLGAHVTEIKAAEALRALADGAREIDMVINVGALKGGEDEAVERDIQAVVDVCAAARAICKVIIECALLTDDEKVRACRAAQRAGADFVKTSTGFSTSGATARDVALMCRTVCGAGLQVKAAGGIRTYDDLKKMLDAGATRIGASAGVQIIRQLTGQDAAPSAPPSSPSSY